MFLCEWFSLKLLDLRWGLWLLPFALMLLQLGIVWLATVYGCMVRYCFVLDASRRNGCSPLLF